VKFVVSVEPGYGVYVVVFELNEFVAGGLIVADVNDDVMLAVLALYGQKSITSLRSYVTTVLAKVVVYDGISYVLSVSSVFAVAASFA